MYIILHSKKFKKALKRLKKTPDFDIDLLHGVLDVLASGQNLAAEFRDHQLVGDMKRFRECHVKNDLLLVYKLEKQLLILTLIDLGSHSDLFD